MYQILMVKDCRVSPFSNRGFFHHHLVTKNLFNSKQDLQSDLLRLMAKRYDIFSYSLSYIRVFCLFDIQKR